MVSDVDQTRRDFSRKRWKIQDMIEATRKVHDAVYLDNYLSVISRASNALPQSAPLQTNRRGFDGLASAATTE